MIEYEESWIFCQILKSRGSVSYRAFFSTLPSSIVTLLLLILEDYYPGLLELLGIHEVNKSQLWGASTAILGMLLSFRTNRAMARFWEGTGLLHQMRGEWFDSVSCCVTFSRSAVETKPQEVKTFRHTIVRLMSLCHGSALAEIADDEPDSVATIDAFGLNNETLQHLKTCKEVHRFNQVEVLLHLIQTIITHGLDHGILKIPPPILSRVYQTLSRGFVNLLNCKKIADTRFPFPYAQLIATLLLLNCILTPLVMASLFEFKFFAVLFTFVPLFGMFAVSYVGIELENPFGTDDNDLPLEHFQSEMNTCLLMLLQENADLIPSVSEKRCVFDFEVIEESLRLSMEEDEALPKKRLSQFARYLSNADLNNVDHALPDDSLVSSDPDAMHLNGVPPGAAPVKRQESPHQPEVEPGGTPIREDVEKFLSSRMNDFSAALERWTQTVESQVTDLSSMFEEIKRSTASIASTVATASPASNPGPPDGRAIMDGFNKSLVQWSSMLEAHMQKLSDITASDFVRHRSSWSAFDKKDEVRGSPRPCGKLSPRSGDDDADQMLSPRDAMFMTNGNQRSSAASRKRD